MADELYTGFGRLSAGTPGQRRTQIRHSDTREHHSRPLRLGHLAECPRRRDLRTVRWAKELGVPQGELMRYFYEGRYVL